MQTALARLQRELRSIMKDPIEGKCVANVVFLSVSRLTSTTSHVDTSIYPSPCCLFLWIGIQLEPDTNTMFKWRYDRGACRDSV